MKRKLVLIPLLAILLLSVAAPALATPNTKLMMVQDVAPGGSTSDADMLGPTGFGFVNYNQDDMYNLRITVSLKNAEPNTEYTIYLVGGPTHASATGYISIGTFMTNEVGNGAPSAIIVPVATLQAAPFGSVGNPAHIDLLGAGYPTTAGAYVVSPINYMLP